MTMEFRLDKAVGGFERVVVYLVTLKEGLSLIQRLEGSDNWHKECNKENDEGLVESTR